MTDRTDIVPDMQCDSSPIPTQPTLVRCHSCGYDIPHNIGSKCPECATIWNRSCDLRQQLRQTVQEEFTHKLKVAGVIWLAILLTYAIGAFIAAGGNDPSIFTLGILGLGFGIIASMGIGMALCRLGPSHQFKLHADIWTKNLWWLHAPWLLIAPLTIIGSLIALLFRVIDPLTGELVMVAVVLIELLAWAVLSLGAGLTWLSKYDGAREQLSIAEAKSVVSFHVIYAILIWLGSGVVGFFGGMLGTIFMVELLGINSLDF